MSEVKLVKVFSAMDNIQAEMILEILQNNGVPAIKKDIGAGSIMNLYTGNSKFGEDIYVAEQDAQRAVEMLEGIGPDESDAEEEQEV